VRNKEDSDVINFDLHKNRILASDIRNVFEVSVFLLKPKITKIRERGNDPLLYSLLSYADEFCESARVLREECTLDSCEDAHNSDLVSQGGVYSSSPHDPRLWRQ
jgi:hypothetical protein